MMFAEALLKHKSPRNNSMNFDRCIAESKETKNNSNNENVDNNDNNEDNPHAVLAREMNGLTIQEREIAFEDIHGVANLPEETPEFLSSILNQFSNELQIEQQRHVILAKHYQTVAVDTPFMKRFKLMYLRCTMFDVSKAVKKFILSLKLLEELFGPDCIGRPLTLQDLGQKGLKALRAGWIQFLPFRDTAGRGVMWKIPAIAYPGITFDDKQRMTWYQILNALEHDTVSQRLGIVLVFYGMERKTVGDLVEEFYKKTYDHVEAMPCRLSSIHFCLPNEQTSAASSMFLKMLLKTVVNTLKARMRIHQGNDMELQYSLMTYGIPVKHAPVSYRGEKKLKYWYSWIERRKQLEQSMKGRNSIAMDTESYKLIEVPHRYDILIGNGVLCQEHTGNLFFHAIVDKYRSAYNDASAPEKKLLIQKILQQVQMEPSVRFLEKNPQGWWVEITDQKIFLRKISKRLSRKIVALPGNDHVVSFSNDPSFSYHRSSSPSSSSSSSSSTNTSSTCSAGWICGITHSNNNANNNNSGGSMKRQKISLQ